MVWFVVSVLLEYVYICLNFLKKQCVGGVEDSEFGLLFNKQEFGLGKYIERKLFFYFRMICKRAIIIYVKLDLVKLFSVIWEGYSLKCIYFIRRKIVICFVVNFKIIL